MANRLFLFDDTIRVSAGVANQAVALLNAYRDYVEGQGGTIVDEEATLAAYEDLISSGDIDKVCYLWGYQYGMVKDGRNLISKLFSLVPIMGAYNPLAQTTDDSKPIWMTDYILMYSSPYGKKMISDALNLGKDSFYVEHNAHNYYGSALTYHVSNDALNTGFRHGVYSNQRCYVITYNADGSSVAVSSNNDYYDNDYNVYKSIYTRSGDTCSIQLLKGGVAFQTLADRTWDREVNTALKIQGSSITTHLLKTLKICKL